MKECEFCIGGYVDDPDSVGCSDTSCCSPAPMRCDECEGTGLAQSNSTEDKLENMRMLNGIAP